MKVVLFCGGRGMRLNDPANTPKPLALVRNRPIVWHLMKYYAHYGHKDFVLCLGHGAQKIKDYFLNYNECTSNDFVWSAGGHDVQPLACDTQDWRITFVETGLDSTLAERLTAVQRFVVGEANFFANYSDGLSDCCLPSLEERHTQSGAIATFLSARPAVSFHFVQARESGAVEAVRSVDEAGLWVNAGFFLLNHAIFDFIGPGEELIEEPFQRLIARRKLQTLRHRGFWQPIDTQKDLQSANECALAGPAPWEIWHQNRPLPRPRMQNGVIKPDLRERIAS